MGSTEKRIRSSWPLIARSMRRLREAREFSLSAPCVLLRGDDVIEIPLSALPQQLKASSALDSPLMREFEQLASRRGWGEAFETLASGERAEEFAEVWNQSEADVEAGARATFQEVVEAVAFARHGFLQSPRRLLVIVETDDLTEVTLVS